MTGPPARTTKTRAIPRGLATVAFLKARFDQGVDHIDMFMPLIRDSIASLPSDSFTCPDAQEALANRHGIAMPQHTVITLLNRAARKGVVKRQFSRYVRLTKDKGENLQAKKSEIESEQSRLAVELQQYASDHGQTIGSAEEALQLILGFFEDNHVAILLGADDISTKGPTLSQREARLVASFTQEVMSAKNDLARTLQNILEGLVVYNAAFLKDVSSPARQFRGLRVFFDTRILFQLLGYEGDAAATLARETLQLLRTAGVQCLAFDKTVFECVGILKLYERKLGTTQGAKQLWPIPMTRYFLTSRYKPSDIRQMIALLPRELAELDIQISPMPRHVPKYTLDEKTLAEALADRTHDLEAPRVLHDVDCASAIITLRRGERSISLAKVKAVFATSTGSVLATVQKWFEDEGESGIGPVVHIRALSNLVWLRRPALAVNLKAHELIALCNAALQPSRKTWERFIEHLETLERSKAINSDEAVALVVSEMTDDLLGHVDDSKIDDDDVVDATTLDEIIDRVKSSYEADALQRLEQYKAEADERVGEADNRVSQVELSAGQQLAEASKREHTTAETLRRLKLRIEGRATTAARIIGWLTAIVLAVVVLIGGILLIIQHPIHGGVTGIIIGVAIIIFILMELLGILSHINSIRLRVEALALPHLRSIFGANEPRLERPAGTVLGLDFGPTDKTDN